MIDFRFLYLKKSIKYPVNLAIERSYDNTYYRFCQRKINGFFFLLRCRFGKHDTFGYN